MDWSCACVATVGRWVRARDPAPALMGQVPWGCSIRLEIASRFTYLFAISLSDTKKQGFRRRPSARRSPAWPRWRGQSVPAASPPHATCGLSRSRSRSKMLGWNRRRSPSVLILLSAAWPRDGAMLIASSSLLAAASVIGVRVDGRSAEKRPDERLVNLWHHSTTVRQRGVRQLVVTRVMGERRILETNA